MRKAAVLAIAAALALSLSACAASEDSSSSSQEQESDPMVENIDFSIEGGNLRYDHFEKANPELTDSENAYVFVFTFTNEQSEPESVESLFRIQFFQNGSELAKSPSYSSKGGDQYNLIQAFFNDAMKGGTVTFGRIVAPKDNSPITIMVKPNGGSQSDGYQTMEVSLGSLGEGSKSAGATVEEIDSTLQGSWDMGGDSTWTFNNGNVSLETTQATMQGTYEIDLDASTIVSHLETSDGTVKTTLPFEYSDGKLTIYKNSSKNETLTKQ